MTLTRLGELMKNFKNERMARAIAASDAAMKDAHELCGEHDCNVCDPIESEDVICADCGEHSVLRESGTECCGAGSRFSSGVSGFSVDGD